MPSFVLDPFIFLSDLKLIGIIPEPLVLGEPVAAGNAAPSKNPSKDLVTKEAKFMLRVELIIFRIILLFKNIQFNLFFWNFF